MDHLGGVPNNGDEDDEFLPLSGKPYFNIFLAKSQLKPLYKLIVPSKVYANLPDSNVPAILTYRGKNWKITFNGGSKVKMFDSRWRNFVVDNDLKMGDACLFEIMELSDGVLKFRVQILRNDFPSELLEGADGSTATTPMVIEDD